MRRKPKRPRKLTTHTEAIKTGCGNAYISQSEPDESYYEIYGQLGKAGGCSACLLTALSRVITVAVNYGTPRAEIMQQLEETYCPQAGPGSFLRSCPGALLEVMKRGVEETG